MTWFMDEGKVGLSQGKLLPENSVDIGIDSLKTNGPIYTSLHPKQDELHFVAPEATYDYRTRHLHATGFRLLRWLMPMFSLIRGKYPLDTRPPWMCLKMQGFWQTSTTGSIICIMHPLPLMGQRTIRDLDITITGMHSGTAMKSILTGSGWIPPR